MTTTSSKLVYSVLPFIIGFWWIFGGSHQTKIMMNSTQLTPGAGGQVLISKGDNGNTRVDVKVEHLAPPAALNPPSNDYVVWLQENGRGPENQGVIKVGKDENGQLRIKTPYKAFRLFITAEPTPTPQMPNNMEVLSARVVMP